MRKALDHPGGENVAVYDDIATLIANDAKAIQGEKDAAAQVQRQAYADADATYAATIAPLDARLADLSHLAQEVQALGGAPTAPSAPESGAAATSDSSSPSTPTDPEPAPSSTPTTPDDSLSQPSEPDEQDTPPAGHENGPDDAIPLANVNTASLAGADPSTPIAVPLNTGAIAVIPAADVLQATDPTVPDEQLSEPQVAVRNSDFA